MTESTRSVGASVGALLFATASIMTTGLGPLLVCLELLLAPPSASSFNPSGMHMAGGVESEVSFRALILVVTAGAGLALALVARRLARGDWMVRRALEVSRAPRVLRLPG